LIEKHVLDNMVKGYEKSAVHSQAYLAERKS
jgi:hypothetical protein